MPSPNEYAWIVYDADYDWFDIEAAYHLKADAEAHASTTNSLVGYLPIKHEFRPEHFTKKGQIREEHRESYGFIY